MKLICQYRHKAVLLYTLTVIATFIGFQSMAQTFDTGTETNISSDTAYNETMYVGFLNPNNTVLIESNSTVSATKVVVGYLSTNNTLTVEDGSLLIAGDATTGGLTNGGVAVGSADGDAALSINNDSSLNTEYLYVGFDATDSGQISLTGEGSALIVAQDALIGTAGSTNTIDVSDGATLSVEGTLTVGSASSTDNEVNIASGGKLFVNETNNIVVVNPDDENGVSVNGNGTLQVGGDIDTGTLEDLGVNLSTHANLELGGSLVLANNEIDDRINIIVNGMLSTNTASWTSTSITTIGDNTSDNSLTFTNGATGFAINSIQLGGSSSSARNELSIGGTGTEFTTDANVIVGAFGEQNVLNASDGGQVLIAENLYLGYRDSATGNQANINSNGVLDVGGDVIVGREGGDSLFTIDGGQVAVANDFILGSGSINNRYNQTGGTNTVAGVFIIGKTEDASGVTTIGQTDTSGNLASVGTNATLHIQQNLTVGQEGAGSILLINEGGVVNVGGDTVIGEASEDNYIFLQPDYSDTRFNVGGDLYVGVDGGNNRFAIYGGTATIDENLYLGSSTNQHELKNYIYLETTNAVLNVTKGMYIGASNSINTLDIVDGATVRAKDLYVGAYEGVSNNVVTVKGEDALLSITNTIQIGSATGTNNTVTVQDGGILNVSQANIVISGDNNILNIADGGTLQTIDWAAANADESIVFDSGSTLELGGSYLGTNRLDEAYALVLDGSIAASDAQWNTGAEALYVGFSNDDNDLVLKDGGLAQTSTDLIVGRNDKTIDNTLTATGADALVDVGNNLIVGRNGSSGNELIIAEGGQVDIDNNLIIGSASGNNNGLISGLSNSVSTLTVGNNLTIGQGADANGNALTISSNASATVSGIATIGSNADNNLMEITETNALFNALSDFVIGAGDASGNEFSITEGTATVAGDLIIGKDEQSSDNIVSISGTNALLQAISDVYVGEEGSDNTLDISNSGVVEVLNAYVGFSTNSQFNTVSVSGTNSTFSVNDTLYAGYEGSGNVVEVLDGASLTAANAYIGYASDGNQIAVSGSNTVFTVLNDLFIGNSDTNINNALGVFEQAQILIGNNASLSHGSRVKIDSASQMEVAGNFNQVQSSTLEVGMSTNQTAPNLTVIGQANLESGATISVYNDGITEDDTNVVQNILVSGALTIDDEAATTSLLLDRINIETSLLLGFTVTVTNSTTIVLDNFIVRSLGEAAGLTGQLLDVADEIEGLADTGNTNAQSMLDILNEMSPSTANQTMDNYYGEKMSSSPAHNAINIGMQSVADQLTMRSDSTRARMGMASANGPEGSSGPHMADQAMQGWVTGYKTWTDKSADSGFGGYDGSIGGFLIGADLSVAEGILAGVAGGAGNAAMDQNNGASTDTDTIFGAAYVSAGTKDWFADASLIYGASSVDTALGSAFDTTADYDAQNTAIYFGGGKEIIGNYLIITPRASLLANYYKQDSYEEKSSNAVGRQVDSFDTLYLQSELGCNLGFYTAMGNVVLKPEFRASWLHEFNAQDETLSYKLIGGTNPYNMILQAPEEDIIKLGVGVSGEIGEYLELRADLDTRRGSGYSDHTLLGSIRYRF